MPNKGFRYEDTVFDHRSEKIIDVSHALRAIPKEVKRRLLEQDRRRYVAFDCDDLLAEGECGRPGHLYG